MEKHKIQHIRKREGNVVDADDVIEEMQELALKGLESRKEKISKKEKQERAKEIALAAIRYYFLKVEKVKDMVFKPEESIKFEGDTGPYLLYSYARARSILRKAKYSEKKKYDIKNVSDQAKNLVLQLGKFPEN